VRWAWKVAGVDEKAREGVRAAEKMFWRVVWLERRADWMFWPALLVERLGRRVREQVVRALKAKRGV
jgi:hypothetical protein